MFFACKDGNSDTLCDLIVTRSSLVFRTEILTIDLRLVVSSVKSRVY